VLDRNYSAGTGGVFCHEVRACLQGREDVLVQGYLTGVGGGDVVPELVHEVVDDLQARQNAGEPEWMGIER
jgi:pyruvate/2-oxoacid:ferredoxin oxidoreductase alpha subunit